MSEPSVQFSLDEFERLAEQRLEERRREKRSRNFREGSPEQLLWLALAPCWTIPLAERSSFPVQGVNVHSVLERMRESSLVWVSEVRNERGELKRPPVYTIDESVRVDVLEAYAETQSDLLEVQPVIALIGTSIMSAIEGRVEEPPPFAPPGVARWAALAARASDSSQIAEEFDRHIERAFVAGSSATIRDWVNAAQSLSAFLLRGGDDSLRQALQRASQRLILLRRRESDERHLEHFYERPAQFEALSELMGPEDDLWAMHFLGGGGVGKTMLMRKITVDWAEQWNAIPARVDFDYLKADYPMLDPGMLLWAFAQDLRAHATPDAFREFNDADKLFARLSQRVRTDISAGKSNRATDNPLFRQALTSYIAALNLMPRRVLLIVDTCEELAKVGFGRTAVENVRETFRILRALHDGVSTLDDENATAPDNERVPRLRVIFSGRRPLARSGNNWSCRDAKGMDDRPYLRLHEVRGFTEEDSRAFLREKMDLNDREIIDAIIVRSRPDTGSVADIDWVNPADATSKELRSNPYDLKLYAGWAKEEPPPTAEEILATPSATQYVELRVIRRLSEPLKPVMPAVALLGHLDALILGEIFGEKVEIETVFELLQQQEWINQHIAQQAGGESNVILDVEPGLRMRLLTYYKDSPLLSEVQPSAARYLEKVTLKHDLGTLDWSYFDAALSALEIDADPERAARWWKRVEERTLAERPPEWVHNLTASMQSEGGAAARRDPQSPPDAPPESSLRPAVLATHASAMLRSAKPTDIMQVWRDLVEIWREVGEKADRVPSKNYAHYLRLRATAGVVAGGLKYNDADATDPELISSLWAYVEDEAARHRHDPQMVASLVAAAEAIVEHAEKIAVADRDSALALPWKPSDSARQRVNDQATDAGRRRIRLSESTDPSIFRLTRIFNQDGSMPMTRQPLEMGDALRGLRAFVNSLAGRVAALFGNGTAAKNLFAASLGGSDYIDPGSRAPWYNWLPPEDIGSRVRLEFARAAYPRLMSPTEVLNEIGDWRISLQSVDNERLHSALLRLRLAEGPVPSKTLAQYDWVDSTNARLVYREEQLVPGPEVCQAHRVTPPLFVTAMEILAANGQADEALQQLSVIARSQSSYSFETLLHADRACAHIVWRMRMRDVGEAGGQSLESSPNIYDRTLFWAVDAQDGLKKSKPIPQLPAELSSPEVAEGRSREVLLSGSPGPITSPPTNLQLQRLEWLHAIWRTRYTNNPAKAKEALDWGKALMASSQRLYEQPSYQSAALLHDCQEVLLLASRYVRETKQSPFTLDTASYKTIQDFMQIRDAAAYLKHERDESPKETLTFWLRWRALRTQANPSDKDDHPVVARLGKRRAAVIAQSEGDLLMLRLPERASVLYWYALRWFKECGDSFGVFITGLSIAMAQGPKLRVSVSVLEETLSDAYEEMRRSVSDAKPFKLPEMGQLAKVMVGRATVEEKDWMPRCWYPWLVRYMLFILEVDRKMTQRVRIGREILQRHLPIAFGETKEAIDLLPADLTLWMDRVTRPPTTWEKTKKVLTGIVIPILYGLAGLALGLAVILYSFKFFRFLLGYVLPGFGAERTWVQVATMGAVGTVAYLLFDLARNAREWWDFNRRRFFIYLLIVALLLGAIAWYYYGAWFTAATTTGVESFKWRSLDWRPFAIAIVFSAVAILVRPLLERLSEWIISMLNIWRRLSRVGVLQLTLTAERQSPLSYDSLAKIPEVEVEMTRTRLKLSLLQLRKVVTPLATRRIEFAGGVVPYAELTDDMLDRVSGFIDDIRRTSKGITTSLPVSVNLDEGQINGPCWEAILQRTYETVLSSGSMEKRKPSREENVQYPSLHCYRTIKVVARRSGQKPARSFVVTSSDGEVAAVVAREGWNPFKAKDINHTTRHLRGRELLNDDYSSAEFLHLIGKAEETDAGVGFRFGQEFSTLSTSQAPAKQSLDDIIRAEDVTRVYSSLAVCIIQQEPRPLSARRSESDRRDAFFARIFASKFFAAGVPLVICIPPLEVRLAVEVIERLTELLAARRRNDFKFLAAVKELRQSIRAYASTSPDPAHAQELPYDLCVYLNIMSR